MTALLSASDLSLGKRLHPTSLTLEAGELACLIGPNGSGKTSLLHAVAGIGSPGGEVRIEDKDPRRLGPQQRQRLFTYLSAARDIKWPLLARDLVSLGLPDEADPADAIRALELEPFLDRRVDHLSTGERSRVLIARALAPAPKLLLLDEPIANLDPLWQLKLMDLLAQMVRMKPMAALVAMHDLDLAHRYASRLIVIQDGKIAADGAPDSIVSGRYIAEIFGIERRGGRWQPL